jgi:hypothetical protein
LPKARGWFQWPFAKREAPARAQEHGNRAREEMGPLEPRWGARTTMVLPP